MKTGQEVRSTPRHPVWRVTAAIAVLLIGSASARLTVWAQGVPSEIFAALRDRHVYVAEAAQPRLSDQAQAGLEAYARQRVSAGYPLKLILLDRPPQGFRTLGQNEAAAFCLKEGFAAFKVPSHTAREAGRLRPSLYTKLVQSVTWSLVAAFDPHLLLVDSFPAGIVQELLPLLRWNMARVFVYRERQPSAATDPYFHNLLAHYHLVIMPHQPSELDLPVPPGLNTCAVGTILLRDRSEALPPEAARRALVGSDDGRPLCYVNFGGGGDKAARDALAVALSVLASHPDLRPVVAPAPLGEDVLTVPSGGATVRFYPIAPYFSGLDMAISAAGYNSHAELLHLGVPTAFVAFDNGIDDQPARVARTVASDPGLAIKSVTPDELEAVLARLQDPVCRRRLSDCGQRLVSNNGAQLAAQKVLELLR